MKGFYNLFMFLFDATKHCIGHTLRTGPK